MKSMRIGLILATAAATGIVGTSCNKTEKSETQPAQKTQPADVKNEAAPKKEAPATAEKAANPLPSDKADVKSEKQEKSGPAVTGAPAWIRDFFGDKLVTADGSEVSPDKLAGKTVGIYFSAHWCPPCRQFTPMLVKTVNELKKDGKNFDVVFVSSDQSKENMLGYMTETKMPWNALPFDSDKKQSLASKYGVRGIPTLVIVDKDGKTVSINGRVEVMQKGTAAFEGWTSK
jgi:nucleoredoxin